MYVHTHRICYVLIFKEKQLKNEEKPEKLVNFLNCKLPLDFDVALKGHFFQLEHLTLHILLILQATWRAFWISNLAKIESVGTFHYCVNTEKVRAGLRRAPTI